MCGGSAPVQSRGRTGRYPRPVRDTRRNLILRSLATLHPESSSGVRPGRLRAAQQGVPRPAPSAHAMAAEPRLLPARQGRPGGPGDGTQTFVCRDARATCVSPHAPSLPSLFVWLITSLCASLSFSSTQEPLNRCGTIDREKCKQRICAQKRVQTHWAGRGERDPPPRDMAGDGDAPELTQVALEDVQVNCRDIRPFSSLLFFPRRVSPLRSCCRLAGMVLQRGLDSLDRTDGAASKLLL